MPIVTIRDEIEATSVVVTRGIALATCIADRIALLGGGRFAALGTAASILASADPAVREPGDGRLAR